MSVLREGGRWRTGMYVAAGVKMSGQVRQRRASEEVEKAVKGHCVAIVRTSNIRRMISFDVSTSSESICCVNCKVTSPST